MAKAVRFRESSQMEFQKVFRGLCETRSSWQAWADFVFMASAAISNAVDQTGPAHDERERRYLSTIKQYSPSEQQLFPQLMAIMVEALEANPNQDFLGEMFMGLELGNHWKGQFFTPYCVCQAMAELAMGSDVLSEKIENKGWVGISDCACGAGATLIAVRNMMVERGISPYSALYVAQDLDETAALMCYLQLSLLGCAGYVVVANSLTHPVPGHLLDPIKTEHNDIWFMPMFYTEVWTWRRLFSRVDRLMQPVATGDETTQEQRQTPSKPISPPRDIETPPAAEIALNVEETGQMTLF